MRRPAIVRAAWKPGMLAASCSMMFLLSVDPAWARQADTILTAEWEVQEGFRLDVHSRGFLIPTGIAFVPEPGTAPDDPLYFVTELHGAVKVVTNDGSVHVFADGFTPIRPLVPLPAGQGENGLAGICLDADNGYVFVTYAFADTTGALRNGMTRFTTRPGEFSAEPVATRSFDALFAADRSANSHQIGPCQVQAGAVYIAVGDGLQSHMSRELASTQGKILRMTVDGEPHPDNPFFQTGEAVTASYVWAYGVRNVFGLKLVGDRLFGSENGLDVDRFFEIDEGRDYQWAGRDWALSMNAAMVFAPAVSPVQLDYVPAGHQAFPAPWQERFYVALAGRADASGPGLIGEKSVVAIDYDFDTRQLRSPPRPILRYRGDGFGAIVATAVGSDGLYFAPLYPREDGTSPVIRLTYDPDRPHAHRIGTAVQPAAVMADKGCLGCHRFRSRGGSVGPALDDPPLLERLVERLANPAYLDSLTAVDELDLEPFTGTAEVRRELAAAAPEDRPHIWVRNRLLEPRFDNPAAAMPNLALTEAEADLLTDYLLQPTGTPPPPSLRQRFNLPPARYRHVAMAFLVGLVLPVVLLLVLRMRRVRSGGDRS